MKPPSLSNWEAGTSAQLVRLARLWTTDRARAALRPLLAHTDLLIASEDELPLVLQRPEAGESKAVKSLLDTGIQEVIIKRGAHGATDFTADGVADRAARQVDAVDPSGADVPARLHRAVTTAAFAVATRGDWEGLPTRDELGLLDEPDGTTAR